MEQFLFALVLEFCSPKACEEYVIDSHLTESDCLDGEKIAKALYQNIPNRVLYTHYADSYGAVYLEGYPNISDKEIQCKMEII